MIVLGRGAWRGVDNGSHSFGARTFYGVFRVSPLEALSLILMCVRFFYFYFYFYSFYLDWFQFVITVILSRFVYALALFHYVFWFARFLLLVFFILDIG